jgi:hypothetical protein
MTSRTSVSIRRDHVLRRESGLRRLLDQLVAGARREADLELLEHRLLEPALGQVPARRLGLGRLPQIRRVELCRTRQQRLQPPTLRLAPLGRRVLGLSLELDVRAIGEELERLHEVESLCLLDERENVALGAAAEADVDLLDGIHLERRRALVVKRAALHQLRPDALELRALLDQSLEVDRVPNPVFRLRRVPRHQKPCGTARSVKTRIA